ncbi:MAG: ATP-binding protein [archaeon]|nr:ATP-binding protein [archaeon]
MKLGTVISTLDGPSTTSFDFVITEKEKVLKGQFVSVDTKEGTIIARIDEIIKTNRYFERPDSVSEYEKGGASISTLFPVSRWEFLIGKAAILGLFSKDMIKRSKFPPSPGAEVIPCEEKNLVKFLNIDIEKGLDIGMLEYQDIPAKINITRLLHKHMAILAMSGAGKSYLATVLFEELMDRKEEYGQVAVVVLDPHGEYTSFAKDRNYLKKVRIIKGNDVQISINDFTSGSFSQFLGGFSPAQEVLLDRALEHLRKEFKDSGAFSLDNLINSLESDASLKSNVKDPVVGKLIALRRLRLFGKFDYPGLKDVKAGNLVIVDMSDLLSQKKRQVIAASLAKNLFAERQRGKIPPFVLVVEEAHNFAPEKTKKENAISKAIIEKIAREGRKFYASLCLISQRPIHLSTTALSQCNTHIILRVTNPYDLEHISRTSEGLTREVMNSISSLRTGEAVIVGEAVGYPSFIKVRERRSDDPLHSKSFEEAAIEFSKTKKQSDKDMDAFL